MSLRKSLQSIVLGAGLFAFGCKDPMDNEDQYTDDRVNLVSRVDKVTRLSATDDAISRRAYSIEVNGGKGLAYFKSVSFDNKHEQYKERVIFEKGKAVIVIPSNDGRSVYVFSKDNMDFAGQDYSFYIRDVKDLPLLITDEKIVSEAEKIGCQVLHEIEKQQKEVLSQNAAAVEADLIGELPAEKVK